MGFAKKFAVGFRLVNAPVWTVSGRATPLRSDTTTHMFGGEETLVKAQGDTAGGGGVNVG